MSKSETNDKDFQYFKERCKHWLEHYKLDHIDIHYIHKDIGQDAYASSSVGEGSMSGMIVLNPDWSNEEHRPVTKDALDKTAFHEATHTLLSRPHEEVIARLWHVTDNHE